MIKKLISIISSNRNQESNRYRQLRQVARITIITSVAISIIYTAGAFILLALRFTLYSPGLLSSMIFLSPVLLAIVYISWKWPAPGGLLALVIGIPALFLISSSSLSIGYKIPYAIFCCIFISGGILAITWTVLNRLKTG